MLFDLFLKALLNVYNNLINKDNSKPSIKDFYPDGYTCQDRHIDENLYKCLSFDDNENIKNKEYDIVKTSKKFTLSYSVEHKYIDINDNIIKNDIKKYFSIINLNDRKYNNENLISSLIGKINIGVSLSSYHINKEFLLNNEYFKFSIDWILEKQDLYNISKNLIQCYYNDDMYDFYVINNIYDDNVIDYFNIDKQPNTIYVLTSHKHHLINKINYKKYSFNIVYITKSSNEISNYVYKNHKMIIDDNKERFVKYSNQEIYNVCHFNIKYKHFVN